MVSGVSTVREVWGLLKQLRMSEANLKRRAEELEALQEGHTLESQLAEMRKRYEERISEMQKEQEELTSSIAKEMDIVVVQANDEINRLRSTVSILENKLAKESSDSDETNRWIDACTNIATLFTGVLNKWFLMINLKCMLWEVLQAINQSSRNNKLNSPMLKFRKVVNALIFTSKLKKLLNNRHAIFDEAQSSDFSISAKQSIQLFHRLTAVAAHYNPLSNKLLSELSHSEPATALQAFLSLRQTAVYASPQFKLGTPDKEIESRLAEASRLISDSAQIIELKDQEIAFIKSGGFNICNCNRN